MPCEMSYLNLKGESTESSSTENHRDEFRVWVTAWVKIKIQTVGSLPCKKPC